jgi:hypothetical protein
MVRTRPYRLWFAGSLLCAGLAIFAPALLAQQIASDADLPDAPGTVDAQSQSQTPHTDPPVVTAPVTNEGKQTKRILYVVPNFRSVSASEKLPPQSVKDKFIQTTEDSFDYSAFIFAGVLAGAAQAEKSEPEFGQGAVGYGRYYWHSLADQGVENYWVEFILPSTLHQDSRYYTLGHGGFVKRAAYSLSRVVITRTDGGHETFNASEIIGAGAASGTSDLYYPSSERTWTKTGQRWLLDVGLDGFTFGFKEFWPDINNAFFHQKD